MRLTSKILLTALFAAFITVPANAKPIATKAGSITGPSGQILKVSNVDKLKNGQKVTVIGKNYDPQLGIYVAYCVLPTDGSVPSNCVGGINKSASSAWISSNPPIYGKLIAKKFKKNGTFSVSIKVVQKIGDVDCKISTCAVITRADHTKSENRSADLFIPVSFK